MFERYERGGTTLNAFYTLRIHTQTHTTYSTSLTSTHRYPTDYCDAYTGRHSHTHAHCAPRTLSFSFAKSQRSAQSVRLKRSKHTHTLVLHSRVRPLNSHENESDENLSFFFVFNGARQQSWRSVISCILREIERQRVCILNEKHI